MFCFCHEVSLALRVLKTLQGLVRLGCGTGELPFLSHHLTENMGIQDNYKSPLLSGKDKFVEELTQGVSLGKIAPTSKCLHRMVRRSYESQGSLKL